jgi:hypothetical protein
MRRALILFILGGVVALMVPVFRPLPQDCAGPAERVCELANSNDEGFVGRVVAPMDENGAIRVQVQHSYRGTATGEIFIAVSPLWQRFNDRSSLLPSPIGDVFRPLTCTRCTGNSARKVRLSNSM